jgi:type II secretory pathway pseudopilin PulG
MRRVIQIKLGREEAFTLLEIMIVIGVIALLVTVAVPIFMDLRGSTYESDAISYMRAIVDAELQYMLIHGTPGSMDQLRAHKLLNVRDVTAYTIAITIDEDEGTWHANANPTATNLDLKYFYVDMSGFVRYEDDQPATAMSPVIRGTM